MGLAEGVYRDTQAYPKYEVYGLASQMKRAAVSIPSNIAEGHTKEATKEYLHHLSHAQGSLAELQTQIELSGRLNYLTDDQVSALIDLTVSLARQMYSLRNSVLKRLSDP
jgi:four helix bundle protein